MRLRTFSAENALLKAVKRTKKGGEALIVFPLRRAVSKQLAWPDLPEGTRGWSPELSEYGAASMVLIPQNEEIAHNAVNVSLTKWCDFAVTHKAKKEGTNSVKAAANTIEVSCKVLFDEPLGCAKLEQYLLSASRSKLEIEYQPEAVQEALPLGEQKPEDAGEQPVLPGTKKRGRPRKEESPE